MNNVKQHSFYTLLLRQSTEYWLALCLENGLIGQGTTQELAIAKLREAIDSMADIYELQPEIVKSISIPELHEFLEIAESDREQIDSSDRREIYELHKVYA
jgi:predicted RNase H-like HicB family nuclease